MSTPKTNSQTLTKGKFHTWWVEHSSPFVWHQPLQLDLLRSEFQLHQLPWNDGEKDARRERREQDRCKAKSDDEPRLACCDKFFDCAKSNCVAKSVDTLGTLSSWLEEDRETCSERWQSRRSVEFSSVAKRCNNGREYEETRSGREGPGTPEFQRKSEEYEETRRIPKPRHRHTISIYLLPTYRILRMFSRMWDRDTVSARVSEEGLAFLPDAIQRSRPLQHFCLRHASRKWYTWSLEKNCTTICISLQGHCEMPMPNLHHGRLELSNLEARTSVDHHSKESEGYGETRSEEFGETRSGNIDFRIQGLPHSTVQREDDVRIETVKKLIDQFETHPNRESLKAHLEKNQKVQSVQREDEGINSQHGKHGVLRDVRDHL